MDVDTPDTSEPRDPIAGWAETARAVAADLERYLSSQLGKKGDYSYVGRLRHLADVIDGET